MRELPYQTYQRITGRRWPGGTSPEIINLLKQYGITAPPGSARANLALQQALLKQGYPPSSSSPTQLPLIQTQTPLQQAQQTQQQAGISTGAMAIQSPLEQRLESLISRAEKILGTTEQTVSGAQTIYQQQVQEAEQTKRTLEPLIETLIRGQLAPAKAEIARIGAAQEASLDVIQSQMAPYAFASTSYENYKASIRRETQEYLARLEALEAAALAGAKIDLYTQVQNLKAQALQNYLNTISEANRQQLSLLQGLANLILSIPEFRQAEAIASATPALLEAQIKQAQQQAVAPQLNFFTEVLNNLLTMFQGKSRLTPADRATLRGVINALGRTLGITDTQMLENIANSLGEAITNQKPQALFSVQGANEILIIGQDREGNIGVINRIPYQAPISMSQSDLESVTTSVLDQVLNQVLQQLLEQ